MNLKTCQPIRAAVAAGLGLVLMAPLASAQTATPVATNTPATSATVVASGTPATTGTAVASTTATAAASPSSSSNPGATATPNPSTPHDSRFFSQTGFRIDNDTFWNYFLARGGIPTFGYPSSRTFTFLGFTTQFFQRRIMQLDQNGNPRLLNLFDQGLFPFTNINGSTFPGPDPAIQGAVPPLSDPNYSTDVLNFIKTNAPNSFAGRPTDYYGVFSNQVPVQAAFPNGGDTSLLPGFDLEMWGAVTSKPAVDPANNNFIYLRFQRGIMMFDGSPGMNITQGVLLADYFKAVITGNNIPPDLNLQAQSSPFYKEYNNSQTNGVNNSNNMPGTNMQFAFDPQ